MGTLNSLVVLTTGLFLWMWSVLYVRPVKTTLSQNFWRYKRKNMPYLQDNFLEGKKTQLEKSDLCFFFQGVLKLVRNLVLCLANARPLTLPSSHTPLAPQHKQHSPNMRKGFHRPFHLTVNIKHVTPQLRHSLSCEIISCVCVNLLHKACSATVISDRVSLYKPRLNDAICVLFGVFRHLCGSEWKRTLKIYRVYVQVPNMSVKVRVFPPVHEECIPVF